MNLKLIFGLIAILIIVLTFVGLVSGIEIYNSTTSNSIYWSWENGGTYNIWMDNELTLTNYTVNNTLLTGLNPNELHLIELRDSNNTIIEGRSYTITNESTENVLTSINEFFDYNSWLFWFIMGIIFFLIGVVSYKTFWVVTIGCEILSLMLYIPEIGVNVNTIGMLLVYSSLILVSGLGYKQER
jgi:hypothetical protein